MQWRRTPTHANAASAQCSSLLTAVTPEATDPVSPPPPPPPPEGSGSAEHAKQGNFLYSATRYFGWLRTEKGARESDALCPTAAPGPGRGLPDAVHDGVVARVGLGEQRRPDRVERRDDGVAVKDADVVDDQVRRPRHEPQRDGHQGNLQRVSIVPGMPLGLFRLSEVGPGRSSRTFASLPSALFCEFSADRRDATFIFFACSLMLFSCADTA